MANTKEEQLREQIQLAEGLQVKLLRHWNKMLDNGTLQATDAATLTRWLMANGWTVDPAKVPRGLRSILTEGLAAAEVEDEVRGDH